MDVIVVDECLARGVPRTVTMRQARQALLAAGLLGAVNEAVAEAGAAAQIDWDFSSEVHRDWPMLLALQPALGWTDQQLDALFIAAAKL